MNNGLTVVVRFHSPARLMELDRALFSIFEQENDPVEVVVVSQRFYSEELEQTLKVISRYDWLSRHVEPRLVNVTDHSGEDLRSRLINIGFKEGSMRYYAILDFDDVTLEGGYQLLINRLRKDSSTAIAFGDIIVNNAHDLGQFIYSSKSERFRYAGERSFRRLLDGNFLPIHSFVLDRMRILEKDLYFNETISRLEDYEFFFAFMFCVKG